LKGASFEVMLNYLDKNFSTGPELSSEIRKIISKGRAAKK
jgi:hypothetical protein